MLNYGSPEPQGEKKKRKLISL